MWRLVDHYKREREKKKEKKEAQTKPTFSVSMTMLSST
jgi:hypothetical protein